MSGRALLNATYIPFAIGGRGRMINNARPIRYTPWYKRNTCANRDAKRDVGYDRWRETGRREDGDGVEKGEEKRRENGGERGPAM